MTSRDEESPPQGEQLPERPDDEVGIAGWWRSPWLRRAVAILLVVFDMAMLALVTTHVHGHARQIAGLLFCLFVPGFAIVGLLRLHDAVLEVALSMAVGIAALVLIGQLAISAHVWDLFAIQVGVAVACLPSLAWQAVRPAPGLVR